MMISRNPFGPGCKRAGGLSKTSMIGVSACALLVQASVATAAAKDALNGFRPHKAVYDVSLAEKDDRASNIRGITGRLVYEMDGDVCVGFTTKFRFVLNFSTPRNEVLSDQQTTTYEAADGKSFRFASKTYTNQKLETQTVGQANLKDEALSVDLKKPEKETVDLGEAIFPTRHLAKIIEAGREGETFVRSMVFDGADTGTQTFFTQSVIGKAKTSTPEESEELPVLPATIASMKYWPVSVSYFKQTDEGNGEGAPFYQVSFKLYENGITRDLKMAYEDFSLKGVLTSLEPSEGALPSEC